MAWFTPESISGRAFSEKKMNNLGNALYDKVCKELDVPFVRSGQFLCFKKISYLPLLVLTIPYWNLTAAGKAHVITGKTLRRLEPGISPEAKCALYFDGAGQYAHTVLPLPLQKTP